MDRWEVEFCRFRGGNPVVEELQAVRAKDVQLATEVVQDLKDLEEFGLALPEKRLHKIVCTRSRGPICGSCERGGSTGSLGRCSSRRGAGCSSLRRSFRRRSGRFRPP